MNIWLLDTGPFVAYLDADDPEHDEVSNALDQFDGQLCTTAAVITEAMHLLEAHQEGPRLLVEFVEASGTEIADCTRLEQLKQACALMKRYADTPMDFADATLVLLAEMLKTTRICTLDRRGFRTYRTPSGKGFTLVIG